MITGSGLMAIVLNSVFSRLISMVRETSKESFFLFRDVVSQIAVSSREWKLGLKFNEML